MSSTADTRRAALARPALTAGEQTPVAGRARGRAPRPWAAPLPRPAARILLAGGFTLAGWLLGAALTGSTASAGEHTACPAGPDTAQTAQTTQTAQTATAKQHHGHARTHRHCSPRPESDGTTGGTTPTGSAPEAGSGTPTGTADGPEAEPSTSTGAAAKPEAEPSTPTGAANKPEAESGTSTETADTPEAGPGTSTGTEAEVTGAETYVATDEPSPGVAAAQQTASTASTTSTTDTPAEQAPVEETPAAAHLSSLPATEPATKPATKPLTKPATKPTTTAPAKNTHTSSLGGGDLLGGLLGGLLEVVGGTLSTLTTTVAGLTETLGQAVLAPLTQPTEQPDVPVLLPLDDVLSPVFDAGSASGGVTATVPAAAVNGVVTQETASAVPAAVPADAPAVVAVVQQTGTGRVVLAHLAEQQNFLPAQAEQPRDSGVHARNGGGGGQSPGLPGGSVTPSAPAPSIGSGHDGPGGARHPFAVHSDDATVTQLRLIGTSRGHDAEGAGREAALPTTSPD